MMASLNSVRQYLFMVLICISPIIRNAEHLFMCFQSSVCLFLSFVMLLQHFIIWTNLSFLKISIPQNSSILEFFSPTWRQVHISLIGNLSVLLEKKMATYSSILDWEISWAEEPGGLLSMGSKGLDTTEQLNHHHLRLIDNLLY